MSDKKSDDITKIEDLPNIDRSEHAEEDFQDLESLAQDLGIEEPPPIDETKHNINFEEKDDQLEDLDTFEDDNSASFDNEYSTEDESDQNNFDDDTFFDDQTEIHTDSPPLEDENSEIQSFNHDVAEGEPEEFKASEEQIFNDQDDLSENSMASLDELEELTKAPIEAQKEQDLEALNLNLDQKNDNPVEDDHLSSSAYSTEQKEEDKSWQRPETFSEVSNFIESASYGDLSAEGNPPFSMIIKNIKYEEDADDILELLLENKVISPDKKEEVKTNLARGQLLISRISEFAAIFLAHKLRKFDIDILCGLTEEINPPKSYQSNDRGLSSKRSLLGNKKVFKTKDSLGSTSQIITSTLSSIEGYRILKIYGIITHSKVIKISDLKGPLEDEIIQHTGGDKEYLKKEQLIRENHYAGQSSFEPYYDIKNMPEPKSRKQNHNLDQLYKEIVDEIIEKVDNPQVNAVLGINFTIGPVEIDDYLSRGPKYQIICSGNLVCMEKI